MAKTDSLVLEIVVDAKTGLPVIKNLREQTKGLGEDMKKGGDSAKGMFGQMALGVGAAMAASRALGIVKDMVVDSIKAYQDSERASTQLDAVLKSTGKAAGYNADQIKAMAAELQRTTAFEDDAILSAQNLLLTFDKISGETFPRTTKVVLDMAQATGQDLKSAMQVAGKALNEPIEGISALTRIGVRFSDSQKDMIKNFVEMGQVSKAQAIILDELEGRFGGSAEAFAKTSAGQLEQLKNAWGDVQEDIGKGFVTELMPVLQDMVKWLAENKDTIVEMGAAAANVFGDMVKLLLGVAKVAWEVGEAIGWIADKVKFLNPGSIGSDLAGAMAQNAKDNFDALKPMVLEFNQIIVDGMEAASVAAKKRQSDEDSFWGSVHTMGERLKKDRAAEREAADKALEAATKKELSAIDSLLEKYNQVPKTLYDQLKEHQAITKEMGLQHDELTSTIKAMEAFAEGMRNMPKRKDAFGDFSGVQVPGLFDVTIPGEQPEAVVAAVTSEWEKLNAQAELFAKTGDSIIDGLEMMGIKTGAIGSIFKNAMSGLSSGLGAIAGSKSQTGLLGLLGSASGWISIGTTALGVLTSIGDAIFGGSGVDDMVSRFDRLGVTISDSVIEKIKEMKDAGIDAGVALAQMTDEIISQGDVTAQNFRGYATMVRDIFMQMDNHRLTTQEGVKELGEAFVALAAKAKEAGIEGNATLANIINDARNRKMIGPEMLAFLDAERGKGTASLPEHIKGIATSQDGYNRALRDTMAIFKSMDADGKSSLEIMEAMGPAIEELLKIKGFVGGEGYLAELLGMRDFVQKNASVLDAMNASKTVMESMANTGILTADRFADAQANMNAYYNQLVEKSGDEKQSLEAIFPMLAKQAWYAKEYGYELDDNTKRLIEQAKQQGLNIDDAIPAEERMLDLQERMVKALEKMAGIFSDDLPAGIAETEAAMKRAAEASDKINIPRGYEDDGEEPTGFATGTFGRYVPIPRGAFDVGEIGRERVSIRGGMMKVTPTTNRTGSDSRPQQVNITLTLPNVTNTNVVSELNRALELNTGGLKTNLIKMTRGH